MTSKCTSLRLSTFLYMFMQKVWIYQELLVINFFDCPEYGFAHFMTLVQTNEFHKYIYHTN